MSNKAKAHIRYKNKAGKIVPGTTTITGVLNKPALVYWGNKLGLKGIDVSKYVDDLADIGILAHYMIMQYLKGEKINTDDYTKNQITQAENCCLSFYEWEKSHPLEPILIETPQISEKYQYGGTLDLYAKINGEHCLIDFKTGKGIYPEMLYQLAGYKQLLIEHGLKVDNARILRIGREESEGFSEKMAGDLKCEWNIFEHCLEIYKLKKEG